MKRTKSGAAPVNQARLDQLQQLQLLAIGAQGILLAAGLMGVATSSPERLADHSQKVVLGIIATAVGARIRPGWYLRQAGRAWIGSLILLVLVLIIGSGSAAGGDTRRWLDIGPVRFQPSEFARLALALQLASALSRRGPNQKLAGTAAAILITTALVLIEPDLGSSFLTFGVGLMLLYSAGVRMTNLLGLLMALTPFGLIGADRYLQSHPYILERLRGHAEQPSKAEGLDQIGMAHRDLKMGGMWGQGPDGLRWSYFAGHTDMIIASIGFSQGLLGVSLVLGSYLLLAHASLGIAKLRAEARLPNGPGLLAIGGVGAVLLQATANLMVAARITPVTGVPLPLASYGFSSMLASCIALGMLHACIRQTKRELQGEEMEPVEIDQEAAS